MTNRSYSTRVKLNPWNFTKYKLKKLSRLSSTVKLNPWNLNSIIISIMYWIFLIMNHLLKKHLCLGPNQETYLIVYSCQTLPGYTRFSGAEMTRLLWLCQALLDLIFLFRSVLVFRVRSWSGFCYFAKLRCVDMFCNFGCRTGRAFGIFPNSVGLKFLCQAMSGFGCWVDRAFVIFPTSIGLKIFFQAVLGFWVLSWLRFMNFSCSVRLKIFVMLWWAFWYRGGFCDFSKLRWT